MFSFYGNGPQGRSFKIAHIFNNYSDLLADKTSLALDIKDGDYVLVSYGKVGTTEYKENLDKDLALTASDEDKYKGTNCNSTFWQKVYNNGWNYNFIAQMTGNTPVFSVDQVNWGKTDETGVTIDNSSIDEPKISFTMPRLNYFLYGDATVNKNENLGEQGYWIDWDYTQNPDVQVGDFYIDTIKGILYKVANTTTKGTLYMEKLCQISETPNSISVLGINPYDSNGNAVVPSVSRDENRNYEYKLPKAPIITASVNPTPGNPKVDSAYSTTGVNFNFTVPKGDKGDKGDPGPQGASLTIIGNITNLSSFDDVTQSTFNSFSPTSTNEAVVVTVGEQSRWYFKLNGTWQYTVASTPASWIDL